MTCAVLVLEDDNLTRDAIANSLTAAGFTVVAAVSTVADAVREVHTQHIDVVILDLDLGPGPTGLDLATYLGLKFSQVGIVILTSSIDPRLIRPSMPQVPEHAAYLVKSKVSDIEILIDAINQVRPNSSSINRLTSHLHKIQLNDTQIQTLRYIAEGMTNSEIARKRHVTEKAVEYTISKIALLLSLEQTSSVNQRVLLTRAYFDMRGRGLA